jgi:hypothetical protein
MNIIENIIPPKTGVRTSKKLKDLRGLVVHWIGVPQSRASVIRKNFERDECGTHYIIDWNNGDIIHCVPDNEVCFHVGANSYTQTKNQICGNDSPNYYLVGIECCINDEDTIPKDFYIRGKYPNLGKPSTIQYEKLVEFCAYWLKKNNLTIDNLFRHYDITNKECHIWFYNDEERWKIFKKEVDLLMKGEITLEEIKEINERIDKLEEKVAQLEKLLLSVNDYAGVKYAWIDDNMPEFARETITKIYNKGLLRGSGPNGELNLSYDDLRFLTILDRAGTFE